MPFSELLNVLQKYFKGEKEKNKFVFSPKHGIDIYVTERGFVLEQWEKGKITYRADEKTVIVKEKAEREGEVGVVAKINASDFIPKIVVENSRNVYLTYDIIPPPSAVTPVSELKQLFEEGFTNGNADIWLTGLKIKINFDYVLIEKPDYDFWAEIRYHGETALTMDIWGAWSESFEMGKIYGYEPLIEVIGNRLKISFKEWKPVFSGRYSGYYAEEFYSRVETYYTLRELTPDTLNLIVAKLGSERRGSLVPILCEDCRIEVRVDRNGWEAEVKEGEGEGKTNIVLEMKNYYNSKVFEIDNKTRLRYSKYVPSLYFNINRHLVAFSIIENPNVSNISSTDPVRQIINGMKTGKGIVMLSGNVNITATEYELYLKSCNMSMTIAPLTIVIGNKRFVYVPKGRAGRSDAVYYFPVVLVLNNFVAIKFV